VFTPLRVKVPVPCLVKEPPVPLMTPAIVVSEESPVVRFFPPRTAEEPATPLSEAIVVPDAVMSEISKVLVALVRLTAVWLEKTPEPERATVPFWIVVGPVEVFTPVNVVLPLPVSCERTVRPAHRARDRRVSCIASGQILRAEDNFGSRHAGDGGDGLGSGTLVREIKDRVGTGEGNLCGVVQRPGTGNGQGAVPDRGGSRVAVHARE